MAATAFSVVTGPNVAAILEAKRDLVYEAVKNAYRSFGDGRAENPASLFLTFEKTDAGSRNRIIALPAYITSPSDVGGVKWISSFPENLARGLPRASAVVVLNDLETGFPIACLEGSRISAARTAASAALGADVLFNGRRQAKRVGFIGNGIIARSILEFLVGTGWTFGAITAYDRDAARMHRFATEISKAVSLQVDEASSAEELMESCDLIVFATTAGEPHLHDTQLLSHNPRILHISLRDLAPQMIMQSYNLVDDKEHCLKARTSLHLAAEKFRTDSFVNDNIYDRLGSAGELTGVTPMDRPAIFSPFGMGVLDIAVADIVFREARHRGHTTEFSDFLGD